MPARVFRVNTHFAACALALLASRGLAVVSATKDAHGCNENEQWNAQLALCTRAPDKAASASPVIDTHNGGITLSTGKSANGTVDDVHFVLSDLETWVQCITFAATPSPRCQSPIPAVPHLAAMPPPHLCRAPAAISPARIFLPRRP